MVLVLCFNRRLCGARVKVEMSTGKRRNNGYGGGSGDRGTGGRRGMSRSGRGWSPGRRSSRSRSRSRDRFRDRKSSRSASRERVRRCATALDCSSQALFCSPSSFF